MMPDRPVLGIYRELAHSPGREQDDARILREVGDRLGDVGYTVVLCGAEEAADAVTADVGGIFAMCEQAGALDVLKRAHASGTAIVNTPAAIENTYRYRTVRLLQGQPVPFPTSWILTTGEETPPPMLPVWIKRYDFHATQPDDVVFAEDETSWRSGLAEFRRRGMARIVAQAHFPGDLIKFYGVGHAAGGPFANQWFTWFYHKDQTLAGHAFDERLLKEAASAAAKTLGVEIFGGDAIVGADGKPIVIDLNAWPSFALYREEAAAHICEYLTARFQAIADAAVG
ncbi:MAG: hypothetical protein QNJ94_05460 [Alphaproteobacteria bacterium]|nr:hypothetical protein [Alphaproteobacteria bacterium]